MAQDFRQRLDLYHGRVVLELGPPGAGARRADLGAPATQDPGGRSGGSAASHGPADGGTHAMASEHALTLHDNVLEAVEMTKAGPAAPGQHRHAGLLSAERDPLQGRGTAVCVGVGDVPVQSPVVHADKQMASLQIAARDTQQLRLVIAAAVTPAGDPLVAAQRTGRGTGHAARPSCRPSISNGAHLVGLFVPADWRVPTAWPIGCAAAYHVHLYTLACVNRGPVPCKWDGGAGLHARRRTYVGVGRVGAGDPFHLPATPTVRTGSKWRRSDAALHADAALFFCSNKHAASGTCRDCGFPETVLPWGHAEDLLLQEGETSGFLLPVGPADRSVWQVPSLQRLRGAIRGYGSCPLFIRRIAPRNR